MAGRVEGKVALITGAARGQGRAHAVKLAAEGADIIAVDLCEQIESNKYPLATEEDLARTAKEVEALDRRVVARKADVRERSQLTEAVTAGVAELGHLDIVVANAGICPMGDQPVQAWVDAVDVDFLGVANTVAAALPHLGPGASIICTGSLASLVPGTVDHPTMGPGGAGYSLAKRMLVPYIASLAVQLAKDMIRINAVHPSNCNTHLLHNDFLYRQFRPDMENPTRDDAIPAFTAFHAMPIPWVEPEDIANAICYLASDESRYVTGQNLGIDAGSFLKFG